MKSRCVCGSVVKTQCSEEELRSFSQKRASNRTCPLLPNHFNHAHLTADTAPSLRASGDMTAPVPACTIHREGSAPSATSLRIGKGKPAPGANHPEFNFTTGCHRPPGQTGRRAITYHSDQYQGGGKYLQKRPPAHGSGRRSQLLGVGLGTSVTT